MSFFEVGALSFAGGVVLFIIAALLFLVVGAKSSQREANLENVLDQMRKEFEASRSASIRAKLAVVREELATIAAEVNALGTEGRRPFDWFVAERDRRLMENLAQATFDEQNEP